MCHVGRMTHGSVWFFTPWPLRTAYCCITLHLTHCIPEIEYIELSQWTAPVTLSPDPSCQHKSRMIHLELDLCNLPLPCVSHQSPLAPIRVTRH